MWLCVLFCCEFVKLCFVSHKLFSFLSIWLWYKTRLILTVSTKIIYGQQFLLTPLNPLLIFINQIHDNVLPNNTLSYFSCHCVSGVAHIFTKSIWWLYVVRMSPLKAISCMQICAFFYSMFYFEDISFNTQIIRPGTSVLPVLGLSFLLLLSYRCLHVWNLLPK